MTYIMVFGVIGVPTADYGMTVYADSIESLCSGESDDILVLAYTQDSVILAFHV